MRTYVYSKKQWFVFKNKREDRVTCKESLSIYTKYVFYEFKGVLGDLIIINSNIYTRNVYNSKQLHQIDERK